MFQLSFILVFAVIFIVVMTKHRNVWKKRHEALAKHFNGQISLDGCSVDFYWQGIKFSATRAAPGAGTSGAGSYGTLQMYLKDSENIVISLDHIQRLTVQASEETKQKILEAISSDKDLESRLKDSLTVGNSRIQCESRTDIDGTHGLKKTHLLTIHGLSVPYLTQPSTLENEIDTLIILARVLELETTM